MGVFLYPIQPIKLYTRQPDSPIVLYR